MEYVNSTPNLLFFYIFRRSCHGSCTIRELYTIDHNINEETFYPYYHGRSIPKTLIIYSIMYVYDRVVDPVLFMCY